MTRRNLIKRRNGKVRPMCRMTCSSKLGELNSRSFPRKGHRIDNMLLKYASNRKASPTFVSQQECAHSVIILERKITTPSLECRNFRAKCRSKVKEVCLCSTATGNCQSVHAL